MRTALALLLLTSPAVAADIDRPPINYPTATADNPVTGLQAKIDAGTVKLAHDDEFGYLRSLLKSLDVPESSQALVFSKTSLQRDKISPQTPRAIYFNDEVYVGFCRHGEVCEVSAADPRLGTVFYTLDQQPVRKPRFDRQTDNCLICHGSTLTRGFPGHLLRSVYADRRGHPILSAGTFRTDHTSPLDQRWGGWYVTGTHGSQTHLGNLVVQRSAETEGRDNPAGQNVTDLKDRFTVGAYPTPHSDIVALMVLDHQAEGHNRLARAALETRLALHYQEELIKAMHEPPGTKYDSVATRIRSTCDDLVKYLLFSEEANLTDRVEGTSGFAAEFATRGPKDSKGRSLRDFDLQTRLFRHPCSYLVYTPSFDALPSEAREYVLRRMHEVLTGKDQSPAFAHLSATDRAAILEILRETKPNLPDYWRR